MLSPECRGVSPVDADPRMEKSPFRHLFKGRKNSVRAEIEGVVIGESERIEAVLRAYPEVRFALFGDDGETDPEVYATMRAKYPTQIAGVFIRRVHRSPERRRYADQQDCDALLDSF